MGDNDVNAVTGLHSRTHRYETIDAAKAIAMILVVIGHFCPENAPIWYKTLVNQIYTFHMPLFFFASGFIYQATYRPVRYLEFAGKKFRRLLIPYYSVSIIVITIKLFTGGSIDLDHPVSAISYLEMLYKPAAGEFLWFIWALWWMMILIPLFRSKRSRLLLLAAALVINQLPIPFTPIFSISRALHFLVWYVAGCVTFDWICSPSRMVRGSILAAAFIIFACSSRTQIHTPESEKILTGLLSLISAGSGIAFTLLVSAYILKMKHRRPGMALLRISATTYSIYLFHTMFEGFGKGILGKLGYPQPDAGTVEWVGIIAFVVSLGVAGPYLLHKVILQRWRITRLLFGMKV